MNFLRKLWQLISAPPTFVAEIDQDGNERWGQIKRTYYSNSPGAGREFQSYSVYDIIWDDGVLEMEIPTYTFQWDRVMYVRHL